MVLSDVYEFCNYSAPVQKGAGLLPLQQERDFVLRAE